MKRQLFKSPLLLSAAVAIVTLSASARQPERGYRGFVDWSNRYARHSYTNTNLKFTDYYTGISTSHGFQFNPWLFVGAGIDYEVDPEYIPQLNFNDYKLSIFLQGRTDLKFGKFTPFADIRLGWNAETNGTVYFSPSIGYRFNWGRKVGLNLGIAYTLDSYRSQKYEIVMIPGGNFDIVPTGKLQNYNRSFLSFRIGIDF